MIRSYAIALIAAPCLILAGSSLAATTTGQKAGTAAAAKPCDNRSKDAKCKKASAAKPAANTAQKAAPPAKPRAPEPRESDQSGAGAAS